MFKKILFATTLISGLLLGNFAYAQFSDRPGLAGSRQTVNKLGEQIDPSYKTGTGRQNLYEMLGGILKVVLQLVGTILFVVVVYAGYTWLTAGGNEKKVEESKKWIINAVIGMALIAGAWLLTSFIMQSLKVDDVETMDETYSE